VFSRNACQGEGSTVEAALILPSRKTTLGIACQGKDRPLKLNCWKVKKCGREPGGANVGELGVCPAAINNAFDGENNGRFGGRCCWLIAGTLCGGEVQGTYAKKLKNCARCDFYHQVREEESKFFTVHRIGADKT